MSAYDSSSGARSEDASLGFFTSGFSFPEEDKAVSLAPLHDPSCKLTIISDKIGGSNPTSHCGGFFKCRMSGNMESATGRGLVLRLPVCRAATRTGGAGVEGDSWVSSFS